MKRLRTIIERADMMSRSAILIALCGLLARPAFAGLEPALVARLARLNSIVAYYDSEDQWITANQPGQDPRTASVLEFERFKVEEFRRLGDRWKYAWMMPLDAKDRIPKNLNPVMSEAFVNTGESVEHLQRLSKEPNPMGSIMKSYPVPAELLAYALGIREIDATSWTKPEELAQNNQIVRPNGDVELSTTKHDGYRYVQLFSAKNDFALASYHAYRPTAKEPNFEIICSEFRTVDGMSLPRVVESHNYTGVDAERKLVRKRRLSAIKYEIDPAHNRAEDYKMAWPDGTTVVDERFGLRVVATDGKLEPRRKVNATSLP